MEWEHKRRVRTRKMESIASQSFVKAWDRQKQNIQREKELERLREFSDGNKNNRQRGKNRNK